MSTLFDDISADAGNFSSLNGARLSLSFDAESKSGTTKSRLVFYDPNTGGIREHLNVDWKIVSMTHSRRGGRLQTFALGEDGQVVVVEKENVWRHDIPRHAFENPRLGPIRKIRAVGDEVIAVGMNRQAYLLDEHGAWRDVSAPPTNANPVSGFEAVVGVSQNDFICGGWNGELWRFHNGRWIQFDSPTNLLITDLTIGAGKIVGCGLAGLVLRGDTTGWQVIEQKPFDLDLYSVAYFGGVEYACSLYGGYYIADDKLCHINYGIQPPKTAHTFCVVEAGMALIGSKDLLILDSKGWRRLE